MLASATCSLYWAISPSSLAKSLRYASLRAFALRPSRDSACASADNRWIGRAALRGRDWDFNSLERLPHLLGDRWIDFRVDRVKENTTAGPASCAIVVVLPIT